MPHVQKVYLSGLDGHAIKSQLCKTYTVSQLKTAIMDLQGVDRLMVIDNETIMKMARDSNYGF